MVSWGKRSIYLDYAFFHKMFPTFSIGPVDLTLDTLSPDTRSSIPTVTDNLFSQGVITANEIGISFEPTTTSVANNGELTFGGTDSTKFTGSITFASLSKLLMESGLYIILIMRHSRHVSF